MFGLQRLSPSRHPGSGFERHGVFVSPPRRGIRFLLPRCEQPCCTVFPPASRHLREDWENVPRWQVGLADKRQGSLLLF